MDEKNLKELLTVAPFECAWRKDLRFREAGRGCVSFEAFAHNDVTVVFREQVGSQHYHYKKDNSPHYTVIIGSHRNRRLKIEVDGKTMVDVAGSGLCCSSAFQSYWISFYDGLISIGKGRYPFQNLVFQWLDAEPNCSVQYIGLSSWDKHVGYRNVNVLPLMQNHISLWQHVDHGEFDATEEDGVEDYEDENPDYEKWGLEHFFENWELSDMFFIVDIEEKLVPAHKAILKASGDFLITSSDESVIQLRWVTYPVLHALLQYIYTGHTQVPQSRLNSLRALSLHFKVMHLANQCDEVIERFKLNKRLFDGKNVAIFYPSSQPHSCMKFPFGVPINIQRLKQLNLTGEDADVDVYAEDHGLITKSHKIILSLWSLPFTKMFTNGMSESFSSKIFLKDVTTEALKAMLNFMYSGELVIEDSTDVEMVLLQVLLLADRYGITHLYQECCKMLLECLSEDSVCRLLQVVSSVASCKLIEEACKRKFSMRFDYCTTTTTDFVLLDEATFSNILMHPDLTVTSEERVLNALLCWSMQAKELHGWEEIDDYLEYLNPDLLFREKIGALKDSLPLVRFALMPYSLLEKLEKSNLSRKLSTFHQLVNEAISYNEGGLTRSEKGQKFQHRRSSYRELQYICDGDNNGVLYYVGTSYGKHQWMNPVLAKRMTITASSPISRYTDPRALASRVYQGTSFSGPRLENGKKCAWWMVDIGEGHQLMCNYYTLRQDGSRAYTRFWNLQGSVDGKTWTNLRIHENDQRMCRPGQFASWPITGATALLPFRYFRVFMTGPTADDSNPWNICICFLELYGFFR